MFEVSTGGVEVKMYPHLIVIITVIMGALTFSCASPGTFSLPLGYQSTREIPSLGSKFGSSLGLAPFKDRRPEKLYIGIHTPYTGMPNHFRSDPFPLEKALQEAIGEGLSRRDVKVVRVSEWDRSPESMKGLETDSVLAMDIDRFWIEGTASLFRTNVKTFVQLAIHLGVKKEGQVYTKRVEFERETTVASLKPEKAQEMINQVISEGLDTYLMNPY